MRQLQQEVREREEALAAKEAELAAQRKAAIARTAADGCVARSLARELSELEALALPVSPHSQFFTSSPHGPGGGGGDGARALRRAHHQRRERGAEGRRARGGRGRNSARVEGARDGRGAGTDQSDVKGPCRISNQAKKDPCRIGEQQCWETP